MEVLHINKVNKGLKNAYKNLYSYSMTIAKEMAIYMIGSLVQDVGRISDPSL